MTINEIRKAASVRDFRPLTTCLTDDRRFSVPHPEFVWIPPEASRTVHVAGKGDDYSVVDPPLVTSIDFVSDGRDSN